MWTAKNLNHYLIAKNKTMKKFTFTVSEEKLKDAIALIKENGEYNSAGHFVVQGIRGEIAYNNEKLEIVISDKPFLASWGMIEDKLNSFFL